MTTSNFCNLDNITKITLIISKYIRDEIEDFHGKYLSDEQMKELNPIIRQALFNILTIFDISQTPETCDYKLAAQDLVNGLKQTLPDYWELPNKETPWKELDELINTMRLLGRTLESLKEI